MSLIDCIVIDCDGHQAAEHAILHSLTGISRRLAHLEHKQEQLMSQVDDAFTSLSTQVNELMTDLERLIADFESKVSGDLTADQQAALTALTDRLAAGKNEIDTADPAAPATPPAA